MTTEQINERFLPEGIVVLEEVEDLNKAYSRKIIDLKPLLDSQIPMHARDCIYKQAENILHRRNPNKVSFNSYQIDPRNPTSESVFYRVVRPGSWFALNLF